MVRFLSSATCASVKAKVLHRANCETVDKVDFVVKVNRVQYIFFINVDLRIHKHENILLTINNIFYCLDKSKKRVFYYLNKHCVV